MQDLNDKVTGGTLTAAEWNEVPSELQNVIQALGLTLTSGDLNQLGKAIAGYVANGSYYIASGPANAYTLAGIGTKQTPPSYTNGFAVRFKVNATNTGASTINVSGLGVKQIRNTQGDVLVGGELLAGSQVILSYDSANGWFEILELGGGGATGGGSDKVIYENDQNITVDYEITAGKNAMSAGPITINDGITLTIPVGSTYTVV
jgi:hypothetical protein